MVVYLQVDIIKCPIWYFVVYDSNFFQINRHELPIKRRFQYCLEISCVNRSPGDSKRLDTIYSLTQKALQLSDLRHLD